MSKWPMSDEEFQKLIRDMPTKETSIGWYLAFLALFIAGAFVLSLFLQGCSGDNEPVQPVIEPERHRGSILMAYEDDDLASAYELSLNTLSWAGGGSEFGVMSTSLSQAMIDGVLVVEVDNQEVSMIINRYDLDAYRPGDKIDLLCWRGDDGTFNECEVEAGGYD